MATVRLRDGEQLHVTCIGKGEPVILLHAFASRGDHWLPNVWPLARRFRFYLPDLRGFGKSHHASLQGRDVFATYAHDVEDICRHFQLDKVILGGISTGAYVCLTYNQLYGFDRVTKYLNIEHGPDSVNCPGKSNGIFREQQQEYFAEFHHLLHITASQQHLDYWQLPNQHRLQLLGAVTAALCRSTHKPLLRKAIATSIAMAEPLFTRFVFPVEHWPTYLQVMQAFMIGGDTRPALDRIQVPTTIMAGRHSQFFSMDAQRELLSHIPHARLVVFERSGHAPMLDEPLKFQQALTRFLVA